MSGRYLEQVSLQDVAATSLVNVWLGEAQEDGSLQQERLALKADGTFEHRVCHTLGRDGAATECRGRWTVHKVRHLGADLQAEGDREITFESEQPLISERLVVCGLNPVLNGFIGHCCRLYPEPSAAAAAAAGEAAEEEAAEEAGSENESAASEEVSEEELRILTESLGLERDRCLAALLFVSRGGATAGSSTARLELAAEELMRQQEEDPPSTSSTAAPADPAPDASKVETLMSCTGRSEAECREALKKHPNIDAAAELLLTSDPSPDPEPPEEPPAKRPRTEGGFDEAEDESGEGDGGFLTAAENDALREHEGMMGDENLDDL